MDDLKNLDEIVGMTKEKKPKAGRKEKESKKEKKVEEKP